MDTQNALSRRATTKSAVGIAAVTSPPGVATAAGDERLHQLMADWRAAYDAATRSTHGSDLPDPLTDRLWAIEDAIAAICPVTVEGFAIKLLVLTNYGEFDLDGSAEVLLPEAEAIAGYAPPVTFRRS